MLCCHLACREDEEGNTPAWYALSAGHVAVAEALFKGGADPNLQCEGGQTYLHLAATTGSAEAAKMLLGRGVQVRVRGQVVTHTHTELVCW
jgi:ankyrin repeat protein